jgi:hypothetical protein
VIVSAVVLGTPTTAANNGEVDEDRLAASATERATYGLPSDLATVRELIESGRDVGTADWGIVLSDAELIQLDLAGRMTFEGDVKERLLPFAEGLDTFAGAYFDQATGGRLVIQLTESSAQTRDELFGLVPNVNRGVEIEYVSHTRDELRAAAASIFGPWAETVPSAELYSVAVDVRMNRLRVTVAADSMSTVEPRLSRVAELVGVPIVAELGGPAVDLTCTDQDHCYSPFKAGIRIRQGSISSTIPCTMGFHTVMSGDNETFVTAGHCGYSGSNNWYHNGYGLVGEELKTQYYSFGRDIMMVNLADSQASLTIYGEGGRLVAGSEWPTVGQNVCASLAWSQGIDCGTIFDDFRLWDSPTCNCTVGGGDTNGINAIFGDSGSPIYRRYSVSGQPRAKAIGVYNTDTGFFAIVNDALYQWGDTLYGS